MHSELHSISLTFECPAGQAVIGHMTVDGMTFKHVKAVRLRFLNPSSNGAQTDHPDVGCYAAGTCKLPVTQAFFEVGLACT